MRQHSRSRTYKCDTCSETFINMIMYAHHIRKHAWAAEKRKLNFRDLEKPSYICVICGEVFNQDTDLQSHHRIHYQHSSISIAPAVLPSSVISSVNNEQRENENLSAASVPQSDKPYEISDNLLPHLSLDNTRSALSLPGFATCINSCNSTL